jgi:protein-arginine kinase
MRDKRLGYLTTDPKDLGTSMKLTVRVNLPKLSKDGRMSAILKMLHLSQNYKVIDDLIKPKSTTESFNESSALVEISSYITLGMSEVIDLLFLFYFE